MRNLEVDVLRGIAIILMVIYHFFYDISQVFNFIDINMKNQYWEIFQTLILSLFLFLVGVSSTFYSKNFNSHLLKFLKIGFFAMLITIFTFIFIRNLFVFFGVLHIISISILLIYFFRKLKYINFLLALSIIFLGNVIVIDNNLLSFIFFNPQITSIDYVPLFPWFGVVLFGIGVGNLLERLLVKRTFLLKLNHSNMFLEKMIRYLEYLGKKSLFIYLIHQPIIISILFVINIISIL